MSKKRYSRIVEELDKGRRAFARARLTAGVLRFLGIALATVAGLVLWAVLQRMLHIYSVPVATAASVIGAGLLIFALVRWLVIPLVRLPDREAFVRMLERRFPAEKNLIVNAFQLGDMERSTQAGQAPDLVEALVDQASDRVSHLDFKTWRDPAPDRPYLWAGAAALVAMAALAIISPSLLTGAFGQVLRPSLAQPPVVTLAVVPGDIEVNRGSDVAVKVLVDGTGEIPTLHFRERQGGEWRLRDFHPQRGNSVTRTSGEWETVLPAVDRNLEYRVSAPRAESATYAIRVMEPPRLLGFRTHFRYPDYTGLAGETVSTGTGDIAALKGTDVDLRVLTNREMSSAYLLWKQDGTAEPVRRELSRVDETTWRADFTLMEPASYSVIIQDETGADRLRTPRYRVNPTEDRPPFLTLHYPQEDHDLYDDLMERVVADAADDFGFSSVQLVYRVDDGEEQYQAYNPYTVGQKEFRLDTLWDMSGLDMLPGSEVSYYLEVHDNDTISGPKAVRSPVRRVRFPSVAEMFEEVTQDHTREIDNLGDMQKEQESLRERLEDLTDELKQGKELNWELQQDMQNALQRQEALEQQVNDVTGRLQETMDKASSRANMNQDLVGKMSEINDLLTNLSNDELRRSFQELSKALDRMDKDAVRRALEEMQMTQEQMLRGLDRTIDLLKQIRREEQVADVVRRTDEIAQLQNKIAEELKELTENAENPEDAANPEDGEPPPTVSPRTGTTRSPRTASPRMARAPSPRTVSPESQDGENAESQDGEPQDGENAESQDGEQNAADGEPSDELPQELQDQLEQVAKELAEEVAKQQAKQDAAKQDAAQQDPANQGEPQDPKDGESKQGEQSQQGEQQQGDQQEGDQSQQSQSEQEQAQEGSEQQSGQQQPQGEQGEQQDQQSGKQQKKETNEERMERLAKEQEQAEALLEELKRQLEMLRKLNQDQPDLAEQMDEMKKSELAQQLQQSMQQAQQSMQGGEPQESADFAFRARDEAEQLAQMAQQMQQQMQSNQAAKNIEMMERIIRGLIGVSGEQEGVVASRVESRDLAKKQFDLVEVTESLAESLQALAKETFAIQTEQQGQLDAALEKMDRATRLYEQGNRRLAVHQGRESAGELNETIVALMKSHSQMCQGQGQGQGSQQMMQQMQGLSEAQQQLNESTRQMMERMAGQQRLSRTEEQRMAQMAAQQEMIRQGLSEMMETFEEARELMGDLDKVGADMESVQEALQQKNLDRPLVERQEQILSRLLDAQRSIRQREMSPTRESKTGTLAQRRSPADLPEHLLERERSLEEDVLRGTDDRYPAQYRRLVEEYFRALSRETTTP